MYLPSAGQLSVPLLLQMQEVMIQGMWGNDVLALPHCGAELTEDGELVYLGPRIRMGMCEGTPTLVMPHTTSGRCDYFGRFVNRHALLALEAPSMLWPCHG